MVRGERRGPIVVGVFVCIVGLGRAVGLGGGRQELRPAGLVSRHSCRSTPPPNPTARPCDGWVRTTGKNKKAKAKAKAAFWLSALLLLLSLLLLLLLF